MISSLLAKSMSRNQPEIYFEKEPLWEKNGK
jgi:hypothetical protein